MSVTTVKIHSSTKSLLDSIRGDRESYDTSIKNLVAAIKKKNLKAELMRGYQEMGKQDLEALEAWEPASREIHGSH